MISNPDCADEGPFCASAPAFAKLLALLPLPRCPRHRTQHDLLSSRCPFGERKRTELASKRPESKPSAERGGARARGKRRELSRRRRVQPAAAGRARRGWPLREEMIIDAASLTSLHLPSIVTPSRSDREHIILLSLHSSSSRSSLTLLRPTWLRCPSSSSSSHSSSFLPASPEGSRRLQAPLGLSRSASTRWTALLPRRLS